jgi:hypothetical protein
MRVITMNERVPLAMRHYRELRNRIVRHFAVLLVCVATAGVVLGEELGLPTEPMPESAPGGGEMVILAPSTDFVLHGRIEESGQVEADCVKESLLNGGVSGATDDTNE